MTNRERAMLILSIVQSVIIWGLLYGFILGMIFTLALLFHEYGHYYWMGREGIKNKTMLMMPPFGAIAITREPWPSLGSEARIALAGPGFGLISALVLLLIYWGSDSYPISMAVWAVCWFNLLNLCLPIAVLDGGRVIKSLLLSLDTGLGIGFYFFSFVSLFLVTLWSLSFFSIILGCILLKILWNDLCTTRNIIASDSLVKMSKQEAISSLALFALIASGLYIIMLINSVWYDDFIRFVTRN